VYKSIFSVFQIKMFWFFRYSSFNCVFRYKVSRYIVKSATMINYFFV